MNQLQVFQQNSQKLSNGPALAEGCEFLKTGDPLEVLGILELFSRKLAAFELSF